MKKLFFLMVAIALFAVKGFAQEQMAEVVDSENAIEAIAEDNSSFIADNKEFDPDIAREFADEMTAIASPNDILGIPLWNKDSLLSMFVLFLVNIIICWLIVHFLYYRKSKRKDYYFTFMLFGTTVFL
ncbi:MAG: hypothetical protein J6W06_05725, partial [Bacteroidales bacterium]|nr:hypothetical protein [Bacteroidales bacterium]